MSCDLALLSRFALACIWPIYTIEASPSAPRPASGFLLATRRESPSRTQPAWWHRARFCRYCRAGGQA